MLRMKKMIRKYATFFTIIVLSVILASYTFCNRQNKEQILIDLVSQALERYHFSPLAYDDDFSRKVFDLYLKRLDFNKRFFTQEDIKKLEPYRTKIDDEIQNQSIEFYSVANEMFYKNIEKVKGYYTDILSKPFTFTGDETYETDPDKSDFPKDDAALKEAWYKALKYQVMVRLNDMIDIQNQAKSDSLSRKTLNKINEETRNGVLPDDSETQDQNAAGKNGKKTVAELEAEARKKVLKLHDDWIKRLKQMSEIDRFSVYLNSITGVFDPHTQYMAPMDKDDFDASMSGQFEGIGAVLQAADSYVKIASLVPGGPSWLQGELKANDIILKVAQENQEPVDIADMALPDVVKMIRGKKGTKVTLTVKKVDSSIKNITITRSVVILEETFAKSAIINDPSGKIGYLYLPKFYHDFKDMENGRSCAEDVANEIEKLKQENVKGIVLDLRNNGGGSLFDCVKMAGLFISKGPVVQVKSKTKSPQILEDTDPAIQYGGPLVIMVNSFSASASEILAAAMQDYHRAIIIGSNTFGKGTVQDQKDLDNFVGPLSQKLGPLGGLLITIQKFYRINGGATQLKGVTPDILLPDPLSEIEVGEREQDYCMPWNKIAPATYTTWTELPKFDQIVQKEDQYISGNSDFKLVKDQAAEVKKQHNETIITLNLEKYEKEEKSIEERNKRYAELTKKDNGLKITTLKSDDAEMKNDTAKLSRNQNWIKDLTKDIQLKEAARVISYENTMK
ncbi:MAG TPA: carboxy terminal-processing peptidase [Bacteroidales bacterium]